MMMMMLMIMTTRTEYLITQSSSTIEVLRPLSGLLTSVEISDSVEVTNVYCFIIDHLIVRIIDRD